MITVKVLLENSSLREEIACRHGLSLYLETPEHKVLFDMAPDVVLGGFHLYSPGSGETEPKEKIREIAHRLKAWHSVYYTGHCTGPLAFSQMKEILGGQLRPMSGGLELRLT